MPPSAVTAYSMPSAGRTSMPTTFAAPLMSALPVTFLVAGSTHTRVLPSTRPMIEAADAAFARNGAARIVLASASVFSPVFMEFSCLLYDDRAGGDLRVPVHAARYGAHPTRLQEQRGDIAAGDNDFVRLDSPTAGGITPSAARAAPFRGPSRASSRSRAC